VYEKKRIVRADTHTHTKRTQTLEHYPPASTELLKHTRLYNGAIRT